VIGSGGVPGTGGAGAGSGGTAGGVAGTGGTSAGSGGRDGSGGGALTSFKLTVIGSSTAAGEGASSSSKGWVSLLSRALDDAVEISWSSSNIAAGGYTSASLTPGSGSAGNIDDAIRGRPNLILVSLAGSNDLSAGTSKATFMSRMETIRDTAESAGVPIFFVSTAPKDLSTSERQALKDWADSMATTFASCWTPDSADRFAPCFIDIFAALANSSLGVQSAYSAGDGIHLNDAGHDRIFRAAEEIVRPYVCSRVRCR
jgi:lysophospholipase L1-like esterase